MKKLPLLFLSLILLFACKQANKQIDEQQLLGTWETIEGFDFEEISFEIDEAENRTVNLVFGQKANLGSWLIAEGNLVIQGPYDTLFFTEVTFSADTLILKQKNEAYSIFYRKTEEQCNSISMLNSLRDISKRDFSEIQDTILEDGTEANYISFNIEVKDDFTVMGNALKPLVDELPNIGFELDNELITEIQTGYFYKKYRLIVTNEYLAPLSDTNNGNDDTSGIYRVIVICYCQQAE